MPPGLVHGPVGSQRFTGVQAHWPSPPMTIQAVLPLRSALPGLTVLTFKLNGLYFSATRLKIWLMSFSSAALNVLGSLSVSYAGVTPGLEPFPHLSLIHIS